MPKAELKVEVNAKS